MNEKRMFSLAVSFAIAALAFSFAPAVACANPGDAPGVDSPVPAAASDTGTNASTETEKADDGTGSIPKGTDPAPGSGQVTLATVYLDPEAGDDLADGATIESPVKTLDVAQKLVAEDGVIATCHAVPIEQSTVLTGLHLVAAEGYTGTLMVVRPGATLTLDSCALEGAGTAAVAVEAGGALSLAGSTAVSPSISLMNGTAGEAAEGMLLIGASFAPTAPITLALESYPANGPIVIGRVAAGATLDAASFALAGTDCTVTVEENALVCTSAEPAPDPGTDPEPGTEPGTETGTDPEPGTDPDPDPNPPEERTLPAPSVTLEASGTVIHAGNPVTLTATATSEEENITFAYAWYRNGEPLKDATGATLEVTEAGEYTVEVTASDGVSTSEAAASDAVALTAEAHDPAAAWSSSYTTHWHACTICKAHLDEAKHTAGAAWIANSRQHWHNCTVCGVSVDIADHTWGAWIVTKEPTTEAAGKREHTCTVCGTTRSEEIPKLKETLPASGDASAALAAGIALPGATAIASALWIDRKRG